MMQFISTFTKGTLLTLIFSFLFANNIFAYSYPPEVIGVKVQQTADSTAVSFSWNQITPAQYSDDVITNYRIYYGTSPVVSVDDYYENDITVAATESTHTFTDFEIGGTYYFSITAVNSSGDESVTYSAEVSTTIEDLNPPTPEPEITPEPAVVEVEAPTTVNSRIETEPVVNTRIESQPTQTPEPEPIVETIIPEPTPEPVIEENTVQASELSIPEPIDTTPPLNPSNLLVNTNKVESDKKVILNWNKAIDIYEDVQDQVLYTRKGLEQWDSGYSIGADIESIEIDVEHNQNYEVKIVTVDQTGNESDGVSYIFSTHLAESGPDSWWSILLAVLVFVGLLWTATRTKQ